MQIIFTVSSLFLIETGQIPAYIIQGLHTVRNAGNVTELIQLDFIVTTYICVDVWLKS